MLKVAVVEDEIQAFHVLVKYLERFQREFGNVFNVIHYQTAEEFLSGNALSFDIIFMDINLPLMNGMEAAKQYRKNNGRAIILFLTNLAQYAIKGYEVDALDYIIKPITYYDFALKMQKVLRRAKDKMHEIIQVSTKTGIKRIVVAEIHYIEVSGHQLRYHTESGDFVINGTLSQLETQLGEMGFSRCNNCYLVNLRYVSEIRSDTVIVGGIGLKISRNRRKAFVNSLTTYLGG